MMKRSILGMVALIAWVAAGWRAEAQGNLALNAPVEVSGATWNGLQPEGVTDGDPSTFSHPLAGSDTLGYYFEVDLGSTYELDRIVLRNRADGCCPERLSNFAVELYADAGGESGARNWRAAVRTDGSHSGVSGVDIVRGNADPAGSFAGRFIRIVNLSDAAYNPQIAELEAYGIPPPQIRVFQAEPDAIVAGEPSVLRWEILGATSATISPFPGAVEATQGQIEVRPDRSTTYTLTASNGGASASAFAQVSVNATALPPEINEFIADNQGGLKDADGDTPDWIEIRNPNPFAIQLEGFALTDDPRRPALWPFPQRRLAAHGFLIVFASGKDRRDTEWHTNFRLDLDGEYLALTDGAKVVQQFPADYPETPIFPKLPKNIGYGLGSGGTLGFLRPPTPGATNGPVFPGVVADTKFSHDRGFYDTNFHVTITTETADAVIRYTTNRTRPTATTGLLYTGPIAITNTTVLRAAAFKADWAPTDVDTHTYLFLSNVIASSVMRTTVTRHATYGPQVRSGLLDVPTVSIVTTTGVTGTSEAKASFEWLRTDGTANTQEDCGVRNFGGAFTDFAKKNFRLYFRAEHGAEKLRWPLFDDYPQDLAPAQEFDQLELRSGSHDMEMRGFYLSNIFVDDTMLEMGQLNPHGRFVHMYLNGTYWGLYHLRERWGAAMHESYLGGSKDDYESINGNWNVGGWAEPGTAYDGDGSVWAQIKRDRGNYAKVKDLLDVPQYVDFMLMWMFGGAEDEYRCVGPNVPGSGFKFYLNDADGWFCGPYYCAAGNRTGRGAPGRSGGDGPGSIFSMLFREGHPDYRVLLADRIGRALVGDGALTSSRNIARLRARTDQIQRAFLAESARWNYLTPAEWASRRDNALNSWLPGRTTQVLADYRSAGFYPALDRPVLNRQGGVVEEGFQIVFTPPRRGSLYYTLDGSDPRLPGGAASPRAAVISSGQAGETIIPAGARWRWFTDAAGLGSSAVVNGAAGWTASNWKHPDFNDAAWREGAAQFGYGEGDEATVIPFGPDANAKWISSYYRHRFDLANLQNIASVELRLKRDDGAIVYINGREAVRSALPAGVVTGSTLAESISDDGQGFSAFTIPASLLVAGRNVVAVELHQAGATSSDTSFDLDLQVFRSNAPQTSNAPPPLARNTIVKARTKDGNEWSALNEAFFQVGSEAIAPGELVISELNYDLERGGGEFVEIANRSPRALNLRGVRFTEGIRFAFPERRDTLVAPGERLVLVEDLFRFQRRYGLEVPVAGVYAGALSRTGEQLTWMAGTNLIASFAYSFGGSWPLASTNQTLVFARPELGQENPLAWRASGISGGAPGAPDSTHFAGDPAEDRDADGFPAIVEYALGTSDTDPAAGLGAVEASVLLDGTLTLSFPRNVLADDAPLTCEASMDLSTWFPAGFLRSEPIDSSRSRETWGIRIPGQPALFLRLNVRP